MNKRTLAPVVQAKQAPEALPARRALRALEEFRATQLLLLYQVHLAHQVIRVLWSV